MNDFAEKRQSIKDLMEYAVPDDRIDEALDLLEIYRDDRLALDMLHEFYSYLPDAVNDWVREIRLVCRHQGVFLLAAITMNQGYLYLVSSEGVEFQGAISEGLWDKEVLGFFGYENREVFLEQCTAPENYAVYEPLGSDQDTCPACYAQAGELHEFGCPVELCPWCGGQLVYCNCRYDKLEVESLTSEADLVRFEEIINEQGRIPYSPEQRPSFADEDPEIVVE